MHREEVIKRKTQFVREKKAQVNALTKQKKRRQSFLIGQGSKYKH